MRAVYICDMGACQADCSHGVPCGVFLVDAEHPHPVRRGHQAHVGTDFDGYMHEWDGQAGKCRRTSPAGRPVPDVVLNA